MKKRELRKNISWYVDELASELEHARYWRNCADVAKHDLAGRDQQIRDLKCLLIEHKAMSAIYGINIRQERDAFRDKALALEEQVAQHPRTVAVSPAYYAEIERDAALSDVAARDERIRVLEGLLTQWLDYPGASFAALRRLAEDTRKALVTVASQCDHCGADLVAVRPAKEQCEECEEVAK